MRSTLAWITFTSLTGTAFAQSKDLTTLLEGNKNLTQFTKLLTSYGDIYANLSFQQDVTVLAPSNAAFNKIPYSSLNSAFQNNQRDIIRSILQYHILSSVQTSESYNGSFKFTPTWLYNQSVTSITGGQVVGGVAQAGNVNIFTSGLGSRSTLIEKDLKFENGIVQTIDSFLIPPANFISTCPQFNLTGIGGTVVKASLDTYFNTAKDLTIFAPNNDALQKLGSTLTHMSVSELSEILKYHVVNSTNFVGYSPALRNGTKLRTRQGGELTITFTSNSLFVNSARITQQDILLSNGVLHIIDNVLNYNATNATPSPATPTQPPVIQGSALEDKNLVPYATYLPTGTSSFASATTTEAASFGVDDIGAAATAGSAEATGTAKTEKLSSPAGRIEMWNGWMGTGLGVVMVWIFGGNFDK